MVAVGVVEQRQHEHRLAVVGQHRLIGGGHRIGPSGRGHRAEGGIGQRFVVGRGAQRKHLVDHHGEERPDAVEGKVRVERAIGLGEDGVAHGRPGQLLHLCGQREVGERLVGGTLGEGVVGLQPDEHAERPGRHLGPHRDAPLQQLVEALEHVLPQVGVGVGLQHHERQRLAGLFGQVGHPAHLLGGGAPVEHGEAALGNLEHATATIGERPPECEQFLPFGEGARHGLAVLGQVGQRPRGGEAEGAGLDRLAHMLGHLGRILGGRRFVAGAGVAHHVAPHRPVGDLGADVHRPAAGLEHVEELGEALPAPGDALGQRCAGDVLDALHQLDQPLLLAGSHRRKAHPAVAGDHGGHPVGGGGFQLGVPGGLAVVVRVDVDEAGRDQAAGGVDRLGGLTVERLADRHDDAVLDRNVGAPRRRTRAVDQRSAGDQQVVHDCPPLRRRPQRRPDQCAAPPPPVR